MEAFHWIVYSLALSSALNHRVDSRPVRPQLRNFDRPETSTIISHSDGTQIGCDDSAPPGFLGGTNADSGASQQLYGPVLSDYRHSVVDEKWVSGPIVRKNQMWPSEASPSIQTIKLDSQSRRWSATENSRWLMSVDPLNEMRSTNQKWLSSFMYPSASPHSTPSPNTEYPSSYYPSPKSYPSSSFSPVFNNWVSLSQSPINHINRILPQQSQPSTSIANWISKKIQPVTAVTDSDRVSGTKNLMENFWTVMKVTPTPTHRSDFATKTYWMFVDEHGTMHMNFTAGPA